ncbi:MAG: alpha/beta hydrolase [Lachnospiraceae bacterium]|nr:alpha/beta hydrolase [Lachnospiraceae bacterium]
MRIIQASQYAEEMNNIAEPALLSIRTSGMMPVKDAKDGEGIYYEIYKTPGAKGAIVLSHGFSENTEKLKEVIYYMVEQGYRVYAVDHRGHGRSFRQSHHPNLANIRRFSDYVEDLHQFVSLIVKTDTDLPLYLYGHSMGGGIAAAYIESYPQDFRKAVLSSPMLKLYLPFPEPVTRLFTGSMCLIGRGDTFGPGQSPYTGLEPFDNSSSANEARFDYYQQKKLANKEFQISATSYSWIYHSVKAIAKIRSAPACAKIRIPVLILRCSADSLIDPKGLDQFAAHTAGCRIVDFDNSRHEIYNSDDSVIAVYYETIFSFLQDQPS